MKELTTTTKKTAETATSFDDKLRKGINDSFDDFIEVTYTDKGDEVCVCRIGASWQLDKAKVEKAIQYLTEREKATMPEKHIEFLLGKLRLVCKKKETDSMSEATLLKAYCEYLRHYPADVLQEVLTDFPKIWADKLRNSGFKADVGWFPTVAEIMAVVDDRLVFRQSLKDCLLRLNNGLVLTDERDKVKNGFTHFDELFNEKLTEFMKQGDSFLVAGKKANEIVNKLKGV